MNYYEAKREGDVLSTSLVGSRENVDKCLAIGRAVGRHEGEHFGELLAALKEMELVGIHSDCKLSCSDHCDYDAGRSCINSQHKCERYNDTVLARLIAKCENVEGT